MIAELIYLWTLLVSTLAYRQPFIVNKEVNFNDARSACVSTRGCDLAVPEAKGWEFWDELNLAESTEYWIGARRQPLLTWTDTGTPLIRKHQCYFLSGITQFPLKLLTNNAPDKCLSQCGTSIVALQDRSCLCVSSADMILANFQPTPPEYCSLYCQRSPYRCGGLNDTSSQSGDLSGYFSVYQLPDRLQLMIGSGSNKLYWKLIVDNEQQKIQITTLLGHNPGRVCVTLEAAYVFQDTNTPCQASKPITFEHVDNMNTTIDKMGKASLEYDSFIIDIANSRQLLWLEGTSFVNVTGRGDCVSIKRTGNNFQFTGTSCNKKIPSICACFKEDSKPSTTTEVMSTSAEHTITTSFSTIPQTPSTPIPTFTPNMKSTVTDSGNALERTSPADVDEATTYEQFSIPEFITNTTSQSSPQPQSSTAVTPNLGSDDVDTKLADTTKHDDTHEQVDLFSTTDIIPASKSEVVQEKTTLSSTTIVIIKSNNPLLPNTSQEASNSVVNSTLKSAAASNIQRKSTGLHPHAIIGIVAGGCVILIAVAVVVVIMVRQNKKSNSFGQRLLKQKRSDAGFNYPI